jgi:hypothetical protein
MRDTTDIQAILQEQGTGAAAGAGAGATAAEAIASAAAGAQGANEPQHWPTPVDCEAAVGFLVCVSDQLSKYIPDLQDQLEGEQEQQQQQQQGTETKRMTSQLAPEVLLLLFLSLGQAAGAALYQQQPGLLSFSCCCQPVSCTHSCQPG